MFISRIQELSLHKTFPMKLNTIFNSPQYRLGKAVLFALLFFGLSNGASAQGSDDTRLAVGAELMEFYLPLLKNQRVAVLVNQTSKIGNTHLVDTLRKVGVKIVKIFVPEHGFRGTADAGAKVANSVDPVTKLPVVSLYGKNKKPTQEQLANVDAVVMDLQDVGVRFYTYISTMQYMMEACAEGKKKFILLDRPNPNCSYIDGPVLDTSLRSFVGMQPVPIVYGMTMGEYALMLVGKQWITPYKLYINVIPCRNYKHNMVYNLPVAPSPNLKSMAAVYLYPSLCLFEGTVVSLGRGTKMPFQQWGHPTFRDESKYSFIPKSMQGATNPPLMGKRCYGELVTEDPLLARDSIINGRLNLSFLIKAYNWYPQKDSFFNNYFDKLVGTRQLRQQIASGMTEEQIRESWQTDLEEFKKIRKYFMLYDDK